jgi:MYXO-CTERM domain-containing protein
MDGDGNWFNEQISDEVSAALRLTSRSGQNTWKFFINGGLESGAFTTEVSVTSVPEASTWLTATLGLLGIAAIRRSHAQPAAMTRG